MARARGKPKGGRKASTSNQAAADDARALAGKYGPGAIEEAAKLAGLVNKGSGKASSEQARIAALNIILAYAYGRPTQATEVTIDRPPLKEVRELSDEELTARINQKLERIDELMSKPLGKLH